MTIKDPDQGSGSLPPFLYFLWFPCDLYIKLIKRVKMVWRSNPLTKQSVAMQYWFIYRHSIKKQQNKRSFLYQALSKFKVMYIFKIYSYIYVYKCYCFYISWVAENFSTQQRRRFKKHDVSIIFLIWKKVFPYMIYTRN